MPQFPGIAAGYTIKNVIELLEKARISYQVQGCGANGVPLAAEIKEKYFKEIFLDVGLCCAALGLNLTQINTAHEIIMINSGGISDQLAGQILRTINGIVCSTISYVR